MCIAAVKAIQALAKEPVPQHIVDLYPDVDALQFGPEYIIPKPMDPRLRECVSKAVSNTAIKQGIAQAAN